VSAVAEEEAGSSGIDGGGDRWSREQRSRQSGGDLKSFGIKSKTTRGELLFIGSKISATILNQNCC
jgi:hypothetical protein